MLCGVPHLLRCPPQWRVSPIQRCFLKNALLYWGVLLYWSVLHLLGCPPHWRVSPVQGCFKKNVLFTVVSFFTEVSLIYWGVPHIEECPPFKDVLKNVLLHWGVLIYWSVRHLLKCPQHWHGVLHSRAFSTTLGNSIIPQPYRLGSGHAQQSWATPQHNTTTVMAWDRPHPAALVWVPRLCISGLQIWLSGFGLVCFFSEFSYFCYFWNQKHWVYGISAFRI